MYTHTQLTNQEKCKKLFKWSLVVTCTSHDLTTDTAGGVFALSDKLNIPVNMSEVTAKPPSNWDGH